METLCTRVERVTRDASARLALIDGERRIDYAGFWRQARRFAARLRDSGLQTGDRVAIILPNRIEAAVACYGTWLAGGVVVPLNAQARLRAFVDHVAGAAMLQPGQEIAQAIVEYLRLDASDRVLSVLPFYYAYGASVLHTHLISGGCVVLGPGLMFPHLVLDAIEQTGATGFSGVPSTFALLLEPLAQRERPLASLRYLTQAGGAMSPALTRRLREQLPAPRLFVMYGQTEATSRISWLPPERLDEKLGSVGVPVAGVQWRIRREDGTAAMPGESGEVCVRGPNVMAGYWNNPVATAQVLRDGWLHTGDLGHLDADGFLFLQGRRSDMIKTGAHRVHPTDVEEVIAELPVVREVAVVGVDDEVMGQVIRAFVVAAGELPPRAEDRIKAHCRARLAAYQMPRQITYVDTLPRTASGKVRRFQLMEQTAPP